MPDWSIKIQGKPAVFTPDIDGTKPGTPLKVVQGDLVSWNNMTRQGHWPVPDDRSSWGLFTATPVDPDELVDRLQCRREGGHDHLLPLLLPSRRARHDHRRRLRPKLTAEKPHRTWRHNGRGRGTRGLS